MKQLSKISGKNINGAQRPIDVYFKQYDDLLKGTTPIVLLVILSVLFYLGLIGTIWTIPFPHLNFLSNYNGYFNWASFVIAALMFFWYSRSPLLSYFLLVLLFGISYAVTILEAAHQPGELSTRIIYLAIAATGLFGFAKLLSKRHLNIFMGLLMVPTWLVRFIVKRSSVKY